MVENAEYAKFARRIMRAMSRRAAADVDSLPVLRDIQDDLERLMVESVAACRDEGYSWAEIGSRLGITRQAAQQRYGRPAPVRYQDVELDGLWASTEG